MDTSLLHLHLSQANKSLQRAKNNSYSDLEKQKYQDSLELLFNKVVDSVEQQHNKTDQFLLESKRVIDFIYKSLEFLDNSTLNLIPYETVECLKLALYEWIKPDETYIIVTSLINDVHGFSFDPALVGVDKQYEIFKRNFGVEFKSRLVQINIPRALSRDYLASVAHYHELGHFVDIKYTITSSLAAALLKQWGAIVNTTPGIELATYFPFLNEQNYSDQLKIQLLQAHFGEYFCDLFASQYVGNSLNMYLSYISEERKTFSISHPTYALRNQVVRDFLEKKSSYLIFFINSALQGIVNKQLEIRFDKLSPDDIYHFLPPTLENARQLHGLLSLAWDIWKGDWTPFKENMNMTVLPDKDRVYSILNNLIEKSIGNYIVANKWKASHQ